MSNNNSSRFGIFAAAAAMGIVSAQSVVVTSASHNINLAPNPAMVTFVATKANTVENAAKDAVLSSAQSQAISTAMRAVPIPIPIVGPLAGPLMKMAFNKFHPATTTGFNIAFVQGLSAKTAVPPGAPSFRVPASSLQGATPALLRVTPSAKDSTRIVRSFRLSAKVNGSSFSPTAENAKLILVAENVISCRQEMSNGDAILIPDAPLEAGEYAVVTVPDAKNNMVPVGLVWDFRIAQTAPAAAAATTPAPPASEPRTISLGQDQSQIVASLGRPEKIARLGAKEIYYYRELKVIFVNNRVAEVI